MDRILVAVDLETTGYEAETEEIIEIGAIRLTVSPDGSVMLGERFLTFADPGRPLTPPILRLTGIRDDELRNAPSSQEAVALFVNFAFRDGSPCFVGHNVGFDVSFLERVARPLVGSRWTAGQGPLAQTTPTPLIPYRSPSRTCSRPMARSR